jgi:DNA-binding transcriptional MerR regulator
MALPLTIGQLARAAGVSAKTIRYYEQVGILPVPRRNATGYRQYDRHDVHRLLFIRRARALGLSVPDLKTLLADLDSGQCLTMRPRLQELLRTQLHTVQQQMADYRLLEQQLSQVLQRLPLLAPSDHADGCQCLEADALASSPTEGRAETTPPTTLASLTLLTTTKGLCYCGCGCDDFSLLHLVPPPSTE